MTTRSMATRSTDKDNTSSLHSNPPKVSINAKKQPKIKEIPLIANLEKLEKIAKTNKSERFVEWYNKYLENINKKKHVIEFVTKDEYKELKKSGRHAVCIVSLNEETDIALEKYMDNDPHKRSHYIGLNRTYAVAPEGYYWRARHMWGGGYLYDLDENELFVKVIEQLNKEE